MSDLVPRATSKIDLPDATLIRKSATGRAELYHKSCDYGFSSIKSSSAITRDVKNASVFITHSSSKIDDWTAPCDFDCWQCCAPFDGPPVPAPRSFDIKEGKYVVYGIFCSLSCAKGYLCEHVSFDHGQQINTLMKMARNVYGVKDIVPSPERCALKRFGGPYTLEEFRANARQVVTRSPPFVCNYMVVEESSLEKTNVSEVWKNSIRGLRRPNEPVRFEAASADQQASLYAQFLDHKKNGADPAPGGAGPSGGLNRYMKQRAP